MRPADLDETPRAGEEPAALVERLAGEKARAAAAAAIGAGELVIAADTVVTVDGAILGKPRDDADATRMLGLLAGRWHEALTGVALLDGGRLVAGVETTRVRFAPLSRREVDWYVGSGEPRDRAGAYAIQGLASLFVTVIEGNYSNVVGLPMPLFYRLLRELGHELASWRAAAPVGR